MLILEKITYSATYLAVIDFSPNASCNSLAEDNNQTIHVKLKLIIMKKFLLISVIMLLSTLFINVGLKAQFDESNVFEPIKLGGPRFGVTYMTGETATTLKDEFGMLPVITQFGWQLEKSFFNLPNGASGVVEAVGLIGGLEQGKVLPSANLLLGYRSPKGVEFGVGPNLSVSGIAFVFGAGVTFKGEYVNVPVNLAVTTSDKGVRISLLVGMTMRRKRG